MPINAAHLRRSSRRPANPALADEIVFFRPTRVNALSYDPDKTSSMERIVANCRNLTAGRSTPADHPPAFDGPISGPGVWRGPDLQNSDEWKYVLSSAERSELLDATENADAQFDNIVDIKKSDFALPTLSGTICDLKQEILHGRGFVLLRGLPLEDLSFAEIATMYWGSEPISVLPARKTLAVISSDTLSILAVRSRTRASAVT